MRRLVGGSLRVISDDETQFEKYQSIFWHTTSPYSVSEKVPSERRRSCRLGPNLAGDDVEMNLHCFAVAVRQHEGGANSTQGRLRQIRRSMRCIDHARPVDASSGLATGEFVFLAHPICPGTRSLRVYRQQVADGLLHRVDTKMRPIPAKQAASTWSESLAGFVIASRVDHCRHYKPSSSARGGVQDRS